MNKLFEERQGFHWWVKALVIATNLFSLGIMWASYAPNDQISASEWGIILVTVFLLLAVGVLIFSYQIHTVMDKHFIKVWLRFFPGIMREKQWHRRDVEALEVLTYRPIPDFGGWGYRVNGKGEVMVNASGNKALAITKKGNSKRDYIGTQRPEDLQAICENWLTARTNGELEV